MFAELVRAVSSVTRGTNDDQYQKMRGTRDGSLFTAEWFEALAQEGRVFVANIGTATGEITFAAGTITTTAPDLWLSVPAGTTVIPLKLVIYMEAFGSNAQFECMAAVGTGGVVGSGGAAITPTSLRTDKPITSGCSIRRTDTGATYMTTNVSEFFRNGQQFAITKTTASATAAGSDPNIFIWNRREHFGGPVMVGASQMMVFASSQAGKGFITLTYAEVPSTSIV